MKNEKRTRKEIINNRLKQAGWNMTDRTHVIEEFDIHLTVVEEPIAPHGLHQYSDYVLLGETPIRKSLIISILLYLA